MALPFAFRLSLYLSLLLACTCLGYAEWAFLPEIAGFAVVVAVMLAVAFRLEGRWSLSIPAANVAGGAVAAVLAVWFAYQFLRPQGSLISTLGFPTGVLPYLGPVLMVVMATKLFRPKDAGDLWAMQGVGLTLVALACVMAADALFAALLGAYLACGLWCLALFHPHREQLGSGTLVADVGPPLGRLPWLGLAARSALGAAGGALALFLLTPPSPGPRWDMPMGGNTRLEVGYSSAPTVDLGRTGRLGVSEEPVFRARVRRADGRPEGGLPPGQRWRGRSLTRYEAGSWKTEAFEGTLLVTDRVRGAPPRPGRKLFKEPPDPRVEPAALPDFGPDQLTIEVRAEPAERPGEFLLEPVWWRPDRAIPVASRIGLRLSPWLQMPDGSFTAIDLPPDVSPHHYTQVTRFGPEPDLGPPLAVDPASLRYLTDGATPRVKEYADGLLRRLIREGRLPAAVEERRDRWLLPAGADHEAVARAFARHFAESGEFGYTLDLRRDDAAIDPVEDFLFNQKRGHCNRFASALVLALRSQEIPARLVMGFRGQTHEGDGVYLVTQSGAHAWCEVLVRRGEASHWLALDPTPDAEFPDAPAGVSGWVGDARERGDSLFRDFVLGYDAGKREAAGSALWGRLRKLLKGEGETASTPRWVWLAAGGAFGLGLAVSLFLVTRSLGRPRPVRAARPDARLGFVRRFHAALAAAGRPVAPHQTAREIAADAAAWLERERPEFAGLPARVAEAANRVRFAGGTLSDGEREALEAEVERFARAVR